MADNFRRVLYMTVYHAAKLMFFDDDDDDDDDDERTVTQEKYENYAEEFVPRMSTRQFKSHFRIDPHTFEVLWGQLQGVCNVQVARGNTELPIDKQLMITLWTLANEESYRSIGDRFGIARSAAWRTVSRTSDRLIELSQKAGIIKWPTEQEALKNAEEFERKSNFPGTVGAIDGSHIPINGPKDSPASYINRKGFHSILLQGVCDPKMSFIDCYAGEAGSIHDQCLYRRSPLSEDLSNGTIQLPNDCHLIGDGAYKISTQMMIPYKCYGFLTDTQKNYNLTLSSSRATIERAFAHLKGRLRRLKHLQNTRLDLAVKLIVSACVIHNICILENDAPDIDEEDEIHQERLLDCAPEPYNDDEGRRGVAKRNAIANALRMRLRR